MIDEVPALQRRRGSREDGHLLPVRPPHTLARYAEVADYLKLGGTTDEEKLENLITAIDELKAKIGIKKTIRDYGIDETDFLNRLDSMVEQAFDDQCTGANPGIPHERDQADVPQRLLRHRRDEISKNRTDALRPKTSQAGGRTVLMKSEGHGRYGQVDFSRFLAIM